MKKWIILLMFFAASAWGQHISGTLELGVASDGTRSLSQFLWEDFGRLQLMQRISATDGRKPRYEFGAGTKLKPRLKLLKLKELTINPTIGYTSDGFLLTSLVASTDNVRFLVLLGG